MEVQSYQAVYTRAYRLPPGVQVPRLQKKLPKHHLFHRVFDSRYLEGKRISRIDDLGTESITLQKYDIPIQVKFEALYHHAGHAVIIVSFLPEKIPSPEQMTEIQNHWVNRTTFLAFGKYHLGARDFCNIAALRLISKYSQNKKRIHTGSFEDEIRQTLDKSGSVPDILKERKLIRNGFYTPTIFGCISLFGIAQKPTVEAIKNSPYMPLTKGADLNKDLIFHEESTAILIKRGFALVFSENISKQGEITVYQLAMLNFIRHFNNYLCGELNQTIEALNRKKQNAGQLLNYTKVLHEQVAYVYDELHDLSLWNKHDLVSTSKIIRESSDWKLNKEVDNGLKKLDLMTSLTSEISKVQNRKNKGVVTFVLAGIGVINLLELIPVWNEHICKKLDFWGPVLTVVAITTGMIAVYFNRED